MLSRDHIDECRRSVEHRHKDGLQTAVNRNLPQPVVTCDRDRRTLRSCLRVAKHPEMTVVMWTVSPFVIDPHA